MRLEFRDHDKLVPSRTNMRFAKKPPDVADLLPSVRARGVLVPLIVRDQPDDPSTSEIIAGLRRWTADGIVRTEGIDHGPLPCAILESGDDADAIEASLIENVARRDPDEVSQWESFVKLVREGRDPADLGATFGIPETGVRRILALGNLLPRIRSLYRAEEIDPATIRHLTMASKKQQSAWLALFDDPDAYVPTGHQLKSWLLGGQSIPTRHALFDLASYKGALVADLFGEDSYFADPEAFWTAQNEAIAAARDAYLDAGWGDVAVLPVGEYFHSWEYARAAKRKGGRIYVELRATGEVVFHEGYQTRKEARARERGETAAAGEKPVRPEVTGPLNTYIDLHRHAAVRAALTGHPGVALRLMVAHAVAGSPLWRVEPEPQATRNQAVAASLANARGEAVFAERHRAVLDLLGLDAERETLVQRFGDADELTHIFLRLLELPDAAVLDCVAVVMGESLAAGSDAVELAGAEIGIDMADWWHADDALFELIRDKAVAEAIVGEVAGELVARANSGEKVKTLKRIVRDHLDGTGGRERRERWVPRWMAFPPQAYTGRGGVGSVAAHARVAAARAARSAAQDQRIAA